MSFGNTVKDGSGTAYWLLQDAAGRQIPGTPFSTELVVDIADNDSDKTFVVAADTEERVLSVYVKLVSDGTAGNRQIEIAYLTDADVVIYRQAVGAVQATGITRYYLLAPGLPDLTSFRDTDLLTTPIASLTLPAGYKIRIKDNKAIAAAGDDMNIQMLVETRSTV